LYLRQQSSPHPPVALRTVAVLEALKGVLASALGLGLLSIIHRDLDDMAERATELLHVNPDGHISNLLFAAADRASEKTLIEFGIFALLYASIRFGEAYGLWKERCWGEWIALVSGCLYLPLEVNGLIHDPRPFKWGLLVVNLLIVGYILGRRLNSARRKNAESPA
jgi:uncharacterized membrane protein (DUF2068 family)